MASETRNKQAEADEIVLPSQDPGQNSLPVLPVRDTVLFPHAVLPSAAEQHGETARYLAPEAPEDCFGPDPVTEARSRRLQPVCYEFRMPYILLINFLDNNTLR